MFKIQKKISIALLILLPCLFFGILAVAQETPNSDNSNNNPPISNPDEDEETENVGEQEDEEEDEEDEELSFIEEQYVRLFGEEALEDQSLSFEEYTQKQIDRATGGFSLGDLGDLGSFSDFGGFSFGIDASFLENKTGIVPDAFGPLDKFFDINIEKGRFSLRDFDDLLGNIEGDDCPVVFHIVAGVCPDGIEGLELPIAAEIEDDGEVRGSGEMRRNSDPERDVLSSNRFVIERDLANLFDQESSRAFAFDYLDETGDEWLLSNALENQALLEGSTLILEDIIQLASDAQALTVTQDVAKNLTGIEQLRSQIDINNGLLLGRINTSLLTIQQQNASQMQLSANISEAFDESNRARRTDQGITALDSFRTTVLIPGLD